MLFTDGSVNPQSKIGYGAYLAVSQIDESKNLLKLDLLKKQIKLKQFTHTSSTKLELQALLWALSDIQNLDGHTTIYTDCQNILSLAGRRSKFEKNQYMTKTNQCINNAELYQEFFKITDQLDCTLVKVQGHQASTHKNQIDSIFTLVDRASRNALRKQTKEKLLL